MKVWTYILTAVFALAALFLYMIPTVIALRRRHPKRVLIFAVNLVLGVTILGYIGAMLWATAPAPQEEK
ncbi:MAG: superinfection immunity protein [Clostridia bacterium]|nr:superinfection immunity protein [Clostridia bacterium]